ncbi:unnamed protein product [Caenorhabditis brenneri]
MTKEWLLYAAYTCSCLEDRTYSFFTSIVLESIGGMRFVSIGQFSESVAQMIFSGWLGRMVDTTSRKNAIITVVLVNNLSLLFSVLSFLGSIFIPDVSMVLLYFSICLCAINRLFLNSEKMILSKDWVLKIHDGNKLSQQNAILTTLDQFLNVLAPIGVGALLSIIGIPETLLVFGVLSAVSFSLKSVLLYRTYQSNESLHYKRQLSDSEPFSSTSTASKLKKPGVLATYLHQKTFFAAIGMALFYKTVMGFDNLAVGYAKSSSDLSIFTIGVIRSYGSLAGMLGVLSYTLMENRIGLINSGFVGLMVQQACSIVAVLTIWIPGSPLLKNDEEGPSVFIFLIAIATARYGLWCLDLTITHSMQTNVPESDRNTVFGFHMALCQAFSVPKELLVIFFPESSQFYLYILSSYFCVTIGQHLFCIYARKTYRK